MNDAVLESNSRPGVRPALQRYGVTGAAVALAFLLRWALDPRLGENDPFLLFILPVFLAGWFAGLRPALAATVAGALLGDFFFVEPRYSLAIRDPEYVARLAAFLASGVLTAWLTETLRRTRAEREQAALQAAEGDRHLRLALEAGRMGSWEWAVRTNVISWSENLEELHGIPKGSFPGTYDAFIELIHPDDREKLQAAVTTALAGGEHLDVEFRFVRADGTTGWMRGTGQVLLGKDGKPVRMIGLGIDVTTQKEAEVAASRLAAIVESSHDAIIGKTLEGTITTWNRGAEQLYGYPAEEVLGRPIELLTPPDRQQDLDRVMAAIRTGERVEAIETVRVTKDGRRIDVSLSLSPIRNRRGELVGAAAIARDITERKRLEADLKAKHEQLQMQAEEMESQYEEMQVQNEELAEQDRQRNEFLAMLGHELRNPLAPIAASAEILRLRGSEDPLLERQFQVIDRQTRHLARIVDDLLDVSRISQGKVSLQKELVDLGAVIDQSVQICHALIEERKQHLTIHLPPRPVRLEADPTRLVQVVCNLLNNAAKYTDSGGRITLTAEVQGTDALLRVRDTGRGIPAHILPRVFDLFVQGERSLARTEGGLGVGLTLVRRLVELHGGTVEARSGGAGKGSEFVVRLPVAPERDASPQPHSTGEMQPGPRQVLLVDDNRDANATLSELLELWGHQVLTAETGAAGLELARSHQPALVLLDIGLPDLDGYQVVRELRSTPETATLRIIALSGYGQPADRAESLSAGFDQHLVKPVEPSILKELLERG